MSDHRRRPRRAPASKPLQALARRDSRRTTRWRERPAAHAEHRPPVRPRLHRLRVQRAGDRVAGRAPRIIGEDGDRAQATAARGQFLDRAAALLGVPSRERTAALSPSESHDLRRSRRDGLFVAVLASDRHCHSNDRVQPEDGSAAVAADSGRTSSAVVRAVVSGGECTHRGEPRLMMSGRYGRRTRSSFTFMRMGGSGGWSAWGGMLAFAPGSFLCYLIYRALLPTGATCRATYPSGSSIQL
jgi:hypothetical protein